jgi:hypothetical protein
MNEFAEASPFIPILETKWEEFEIRLHFEDADLSCLLGSQVPQTPFIRSLMT